MRTLTLSRLRDTTNSTGLQDLTQGPAAAATADVPSEAGVARQDTIAALVGSTTEFPCVPAVEPSFAATIQQVRGSKGNLVARSWLLDKLSKRIRLISELLTH